MFPTMPTDRAWPSLLTHLQGLRCALAVAECGSTVQAAKALHLSQSSVVRAVEQLEAATALALFHRHARGMQASQASAALLRRAERALAHLTLEPSRAAAQRSHWLAAPLARGGAQLQTLVVLGRTLSLSAAAAELELSAAAVHQRLAQLEQWAGRALFIRSRSGLRATPAGELTLTAVKRCVAELAQADEELSLQRGSAIGRLVIGTLPFSTGLLLPRAIEEVLRLYPGMQITVIDGTYPALLQQLAQADIDLMVGALRPQLEDRELAQEILFRDPLAVFARAGHRLAARKALRWKHLADAQWVLPMPDTPAEAVFLQALRDAGLPLRPGQLRVNSAVMMQALLHDSDRLALMSPRQLEREVRAGLLVQLPLPVRPLRTIGTIARADYLPTPAAAHLLELFRAMGRELSC
jgi:LysR family transcriptional regulator of gallate degradation